MSVTATIAKSGGDGSGFRPKVGPTIGLLAEVMDKGWQVYDPSTKKYRSCARDTPKARHGALGIFLLPEQVCGDNVPDDRKGTPKLAFLDIKSVKFNESDDPAYRTVFQHYLAGWFGRSVPKDRWEDFSFGREWGDGSGQLKRGLKGDEAKAQTRAKPGVPVGYPALVRIVYDGTCGICESSIDLPADHEGNMVRCAQHAEVTDGSDGKIWARIASPRPPKAPDVPSELADYGEMVKTWTPGLSPAGNEGKKWSFGENMELLKDGEPVGYVYPGWAVISAKNDDDTGGSSAKTKEQRGNFDEPEDDNIPF